MGEWCSLSQFLRLVPLLRRCKAAEV